MYQLKIGTIPLPKLYICEKNEAEKCRKLGVPYLIKPRGWSDDKIIKAVLWRTLKEKFPYIKWKELFNINGRAANKVFVPSEHRENPGYDTTGDSSPNMEVSVDGEYRSTGGGLDANNKIDFSSEKYNELTIDKYIGDLGFYVNIEELQQLKLLPVFLDDIANAIKMNIMNTLYMDGYNKKLECNMGSWKGSDQAPNLIVLDVSASIPSGVAGTMVSLIETLRNQANADLIITSGRSEYWAANTELPTPDRLSKMIGGCNECVQFYSILREHVLGKHWGNVIVFGDQDSPLRQDIQWSVRNGKTTNISERELQSTRIDRIMGFHTHRKVMPGYGLWARDACPKAEVVLNNSWVDSMEKD